MQGVGHLLIEGLDLILPPLLAGVDQKQAENVRLQSVSRVQRVTGETTKETLVQVDPETLQ